MPRSLLSLLVKALFIFPLQCVGFLLLAWLVGVFVMLLFAMVLDSVSIHAYVATLLKTQQAMLPGSMSITHELDNLHTFFEQGQIRLQRITSSLPKAFVFKKAWVTHGVSAWLTASITLAQLLLLRLVCFFLYLPLLFLFMLIALIDGWTVRLKRRVTGARESMWLFHLAFHGIYPLLWIGLACFVLSPIAISPVFIGAMLSFSVAFLVWLMSATLKKYL